MMSKQDELFKEIVTKLKPTYPPELNLDSDEIPKVSELLSFQAQIIKDAFNSYYFNISNSDLSLLTLLFFGANQYQGVNLFGLSLFRSDFKTKLFNQQSITFFFDYLNAVATTYSNMLPDSFSANSLMNYLNACETALKNNATNPESIYVTTIINCCIELYKLIEFALTDAFLSVFRNNDKKN